MFITFYSFDDHIIGWMEYYIQCKNRTKWMNDDLVPESCYSNNNNNNSVDIGNKINWIKMLKKLITSFI